MQSAAATLHELAQQLWTLRISPSDALARTAGAIALSGLIGLERERRQRAAGLRTHMLVALATAVLTIMAFEVVERVAVAEGLAIADPLRLAALAR
ncbi:MgtC/SapB family protein [Rubrimonas cliftonensis]|nr:MgtC/SapB family protein [Rubrimonas cliftonensis]